MFPSRYEGFGLPALEAMSLGTPVVAGDAASLPAVVGHAGWLIDPDDTDAWGDAMLRLLHDGDERERLAAAGLERASAFSWAATARATLAAYRDAVDDVPGTGEAVAPSELPSTVTGEPRQSEPDPSDPLPSSEGGEQP